MTADIARLKELLAKFPEKWEAKYISPRNEYSQPSWDVGGFQRYTSIADEVESGPARMEGPTKDIAELIAVMKNALPSLLAGVEQLRRGEFICQKCGIRKDSEHAKGDF